MLDSGGVPSLLLADLGGPEVLIIVFVLLFVFGAKKLPEIARGAGQAVRAFKEETHDADLEKRTDPDR